MDVHDAMQLLRSGQRVRIDIDIRQGLQQIIQMNRSVWIGIFEKVEDTK
jgi:hypothetical protein